ncbi:MAG: transcriptional repressor [Planctomycetota bacterium]|nr:MAG: transcriptional repressor [Planctomycetota bacterium]
MSRRKTTDLRSLIREKGLRATPARVAVCEVLERATSPLTHADVAKLLDARGTDQTTVFRNLNDLVEVNLVRRLEVGDHVYRFEWCGATAPNTGHAHFMCVDCGEVSCLEDLQPSQPTAVARASKKLIGDITEVLYKGHCAHCV